MKGKSNSSSTQSAGRGSCCQVWAENTIYATPPDATSSGVERLAFRWIPQAFLANNDENCAKSVSFSLLFHSTTSTIGTNDSCYSSIARSHIVVAGFGLRATPRRQSLHRTLDWDLSEPVRLRDNYSPTAVLQCVFEICLYPDVILFYTFFPRTPSLHSLLYRRRESVHLVTHSTNTVTMIIFQCTVVNPRKKHRTVEEQMALSVVAQVLRCNLIQSDPMAVELALSLCPRKTA